VSVDLRRAADYDDLSERAAAFVADRIRETPAPRIVVATGRTPMGAYERLARRVARGDLDASAVTAFQLDEYLDLEAGDARSLGGWAVTTFVRPLRLSDDRFVRLPLDGAAGLRAYDERVHDDGGYDLAILGIGENGHLGFNEPPSEASSPSRVVELTPETIASNAGYWGDADVPRRAATVGLAPLLASRSILLLASGGAKRAILERALFGPVTPDVPASALQTASADVVVIADADAFPDTASDGGAA
jgi:glucosamine-6-phosphate deaminase